MTYRELIKACCEITNDKCCHKCKYTKECKAFADKTGLHFPYISQQILNLDLDEEIEVEE